MPYKHQILTEINRRELGCAGRSFQKTVKFALNKRTVSLKKDETLVPISHPPFSLLLVLVTSLTAILS